MDLNFNGLFCWRCAKQISKNSSNHWRYTTKHLYKSGRTVSLTMDPNVVWNSKLCSVKKSAVNFQCWNIWECEVVIWFFSLKKKLVRSTY